MVDFLDALKLVVENTKESQKYETLSLFEVGGRVLAEDIFCKRALPPFDNSAMDGYGIRLSDSGKKLLVKESIYAGDEIGDSYIKEGECIKIMTGAPVPPSVEAIVPFENAISCGDGFVTIPDGVKNGANVRLRGEESKEGDLLVKKGTTLTAGAIGSIASQGIFAVSVSQKPKVAVLSTGNEIKEVWQDAKDGQIYNTNAPMLLSLCKDAGCEASYIRVVTDTKESTIEAIKALSGFDMIITTGGISMGEADFVGSAFLECGMEPIFKKIALKPGKPTMYGYMGNTVVLALPGNPISAVANFLVYGRSAIEKIKGSSEYWPVFVPALNKTAFRFKNSRANLILGRYENGVFEVFDSYRYGSGMIKPMVWSNSFVVAPESVEGYDEGDTLKVIPLGFKMSSSFVDFLSYK